MQDVELRKLKDEVKEKELTINTLNNSDKEKEADLLLNRKEQDKLSLLVNKKDSEINNLRTTILNLESAKVKYKCDECNEEFSSVKELKNHVLQFHNVVQERFERIRDICKSYKNLIKQTLEDLQKDNLLDLIDDYIPRHWKQKENRDDEDK